MQTLNSNLLDESFSNIVDISIESSVCDIVNREIGDGFFYKKCKDDSEKNIGIKNYGLFKKYIDGTVQQGKKLNDEGKIIVGYTTEDLGGGAKKANPIYDFPPKGKGIIKGDDKGDYYYFEELPEFRKQQIQKLENQKKEEQNRIDAQKRQKELENQKRQKELENQKIQEQLSKSEELKRKEEDKIKKNKIKIYSITAISILALGIVYFKFIKK
jgi:hypothetical protein